MILKHIVMIFYISSILIGRTPIDMQHLGLKIKTEKIEKPKKITEFFKNRNRKSNFLKNQKFSVFIRF